MGVSPLGLVDKDILLPENLIRHPLGAEALGEPKASALARKIHNAFPLCDSFGIDTDFLTLSRTRQLRLVSAADVVVAATDMFECQRHINQLCLEAEVSAVYPGVWVDPRMRDAEVGEILWVLAGQHTPCFECAFSFRQSEADAQAGRGAQSDIKLLSLITSQVVAALINPRDPRAALLELDRTLITVHGFMPTSPAIRARFPTDGLRNVSAHVPFPPSPCPACGGQEVRSRPQLVPGLPHIPRHAQPVPELSEFPAMPEEELDEILLARRLAGQMRPIRQPASDQSWRLPRVAWLFTTIAVLLVLIRPIASIEATSYPIWNTIFRVSFLVVFLYGLYRTFRPRRGYLRRRGYSGRARLGVVLSAILLFISIVIFAAHNGYPAQASSGSQQSSGGIGAQAGSGNADRTPVPSSTLPKTASAAFDITPTFTAASGTISGVSGDSENNVIQMSLVPSLKGWQLNTQVNATYTASDVSNLAGYSTSPVADLADSCMEIQTPAGPDGQNVPLEELPLTTHLSFSGGKVTGDITYSAVMPGSYSLDLNCLEPNGSQSNFIAVGAVFVPNLGILYGNGNFGLGSNDNAVVIFKEVSSSTDTALLYGAIGGVNDGSEPHPTASTCINVSPPNQENSLNVMQASVAIKQQVTGKHEWFEVGVMTYNLSASQLAEDQGGAFFYSCGDTSQDIPIASSSSQ